MFHSKTLKQKINRIHECVLSIVKYNDVPFYNQGKKYSKISDWNV